MAALLPPCPTCRLWLIASMWCLLPPQKSQASPSGRGIGHNLRPSR
uniref:Uncharacterized protein n=1 Tax=Arundo donax TaxID=35708 RepID=A0A0A9EQ19_ARUDO